MPPEADPPDRIGYLDALRGVAILCILPVNAAWFAYPASLGEEPGYPPGDGALHALGIASCRAVELLFESKFHTIFSVLFGVGLVLLREGALRRGERWGPVAARRLLFLGALGVAHAVLLWYGDILAYYALFGLALAWAAGKPARALRGWGIALLALPLLVMLAGLAAALIWEEPLAAFLATHTATALPDGRVEGWTPGSWEGFGEQLLKFDPDFETAVYRGDSILQATVLRAGTWAAASVVIGPLWGPRIAGLMLLGMALARGGWFLAPGSGEGRRRFASMLRWGLLVGVPLSLAALLVRVLGSPKSPSAMLGAEVVQYVGSLGLAAAYAALVARACASPALAAAVRGAAAVGRLALSNYLLQTAVMTILFNGTTVFLGAGLGFFAAVGRLELMAVVLAVSVAQIALSLLWLRRFRWGPMEWLWRAFTHLRRPGAPIG